MASAKTGPAAKASVASKAKAAVAKAASVASKAKGAVAKAVGVTSKAKGAVGNATGVTSKAKGAVGNATGVTSKAKGAVSKTKPVATSKLTAAASKSQSVAASKGRSAAASKSQPVAASKVRSAAGGGDKKRLGVGDRAPAFKLMDDRGQQVSSDSLRGSSYVLYFYPKDDTPGCTLEACGFRDSLPRFSAKKVKVLGVSPDPTSAHERFKRKYGLTFPLLSDPDKTLANAYGVWVMKQNYGREYMGIERSTFVVDGKGVIQQAYRGVRVPGHVDAVLASV
jgi:peroxiredoxin Q/BCP